MKSKLALISAAFCLVAAATSTAVMAKTFDVGTEDSAQFVDAQVVSKIHPTLPTHLHENCFKSCCIARFLIDAEGKAKVKLLSSSGSDEIDDITLEALRRWKFKPAMLDGKPVPSTRRVKVEFEIN